MLLLPGLVALTVRLIPREVMDQCREEARSLWPDGGPKRWCFALPIVAIWLLVAALMVKAIWF